MIVRLAEQARREFGIYWPGLYIVSGFRTQRRNAEVKGAAGSFHTFCPSLAADLRVGSVAGLPQDEVQAIIGGMWRRMGGRWGGTFKNPSVRHFDIGSVG